MSKESEQEKKDKLWTAYFDGELSSSESLEFDNALSDKERKRLIAERRFESALGDRLSGDIKCPDELWNRVAAQMRRADRRVMPPLVWKLVATGAAAAGLLLVVSLVFLTGRHNPAAENPGFAEVDSGDDFLQLVAVTELEQRAEVAGDAAVATKFLAARGIAVAVQPLAVVVPPESPHDAVFLGARERMVGRDRVVDLMWNCCGKPVIVSIAAEGSAAAARIGRAFGDGRVSGQRRLGGHVAGLVSEHASPAFLGLLIPATPNVS
ncbi:MAG: hypothetical protein O2923_11140 [Verrucomicrobia bacterium]|nr:hypothetical protein [Verrucomicrobiota bacterium]MDA1087211.1 hypothetical protein [Verrucomicrobiota bacterium]